MSPESVRNRALEEAKRFGKPIETEIVRTSASYPAEEYHQDFYEKHPPLQYKFYRFSCGRDARLRELGAVTRLG